MILQELRRNAYLIGDLEGQPVGAFNTRQLRPDRQAKLKPEDEPEEYESEEESPDETQEEEIEEELPDESREIEEPEPQEQPSRRRRR